MFHFPVSDHLLGAKPRRLCDTVAAMIASNLIRQPSPLTVVCLSLLKIACSDYPQDYQGGLADTPQRQWIMFGRSAYRFGYDEGSTDAFFKWVDSNPDHHDDDRMGILPPAFPEARLQALRESSQPIAG